MFSFLRKKKNSVEGEGSAAPQDFSFLRVDMHSHILPGIDDGAPDIRTAIDMVRRLAGLGYAKLIASPHVFGDFYPNTNERIEDALQKLRIAVATAGLMIEIDAIAEYYLDDYFLKNVLPNGLRTLDNERVLVEVSMAGWPHNFSDMLFEVKARGYVPVLAHPERYLYESSVKVFEGLRAGGVEMALNTLSMTGYYGQAVKESALRIMDAQLYSYCGTDAHHGRHLANLQGIVDDRPEVMQRLANYGFANSALYNRSTGGPAELG